jgi:peptidoglycan/xylan/chitin deacetylase (PgdA/CDA1 family)
VWLLAVLACAGFLGAGMLGGTTHPSRAAAAERVVRTPTAVSPEAKELHRLIDANAALFAGSAKGRVVALTFDDGPGPYTARIVAALRRLKAPATFFEVGEQIKPYRVLVANMVKWGFVIGDHTWTHPDLELLSNARVKDQVNWTKEMITKVSGEQVQFIRPPYGAQNARIRTDVGRLGLLSVLWNIDTRDWSLPGTSSIIASALAVRPGGIVLMHDGGGPRGETLAALPAIVRGLRARGFRLVTIPQLLAIAPPTHLQY